MRPQIVKKIKILAPAVLCFFASTMVLGQSKTGSSGPPTPTNQLGPQLPIDDNLVILFAIGLAYGCYIAYKRYSVKNTLAQAD